jgi:hypothetical protein
MRERVNYSFEIENTKNPTSMEHKQTGSPVLSVLSACHVLVILFWLNSSGCPVLAVLFRLSFSAALSFLSCLGCLILAAMC